MIILFMDYFSVIEICNTVSLQKFTHLLLYIFIIEKFWMFSRTPHKKNKWYFL